MLKALAIISVQILTLTNILKTVRTKIFNCNQYELVNNY